MNIEVKVAWASSAGDFLPFTPLPARFHGKTVLLVMADEADEPIPYTLTDAGRATAAMGASHE